LSFKEPTVLSDLLVYLALDKVKPITILVDMYVEAFGTIKEANMVGKEK